MDGLQPGAGPGNQRTLAHVLESWRAAERRLASGAGDTIQLRAEIRSLRDEYRRLQNNLVGADGANGSTIAFEGPPVKRRVLTNEA